MLIPLIQKRVEKKVREKVGIKFDPEIIKKLGLTSHTEWVITSKDITTYVNKEILLPEKSKTEEEINIGGTDFRILTTAMFKDHEAQLEKRRRKLRGNYHEIPVKKSHR